MHALSILRTFAASLLLTTAAMAALPPLEAPPVTLGIGSAAPALQIASWAKGTPVTKFEPGKTYVVEFWATWCGPCKAAIPHLSELAKEYDGRATFIGVDIAEWNAKTDDEVHAKIVKFVETMGSKMDYTVAIDSTERPMAANWLDAAGIDGIPATFVINRQGQVAWMGMPDELPPVLAKVVDGSWDLGAEKTRVDQARLVELPKRDLTRTVMMSRGDPAATLAACDKAEKAAPPLAGDPQLIAWKLGALLKSDAARSVAYAQSLTAASGPIAATPTKIIALMNAMPDPAATSPLAAADWQAIAAAVEPFVASAKSDSGSFDAEYAELLSRAGRHDAALAAMQKSVEQTVAYNAKHVGVGDEHESFFVAALKKRQARLDDLMAGASQSSATR